MSQSPSSFHHLGLTVSNLERSHRFYREVVGMRDELTMEVASDAFNALMASEGLSIRFWYLTLGTLRLQLVEYTRGGEPEPLALAHNRIGNPHLSIAVEDVARKYEELKQRGDVPMVSAIVTQTHGSMTAQSFYVLDPDGVQVEFGCIRYNSAA